MLVLRCTQKLLSRLGPPVDDPPPSTTALGDWYARPLNIGHQRLVLLISERSRLPLLMQARELKRLPQTFPKALAAVLIELGVPATNLIPELDAAADVVVAKTNSRSHLGSLNEFAQMLTWQREPLVDLVGESVELSRTPVGPLGPGWPDEVTLRLLGCEKHFRGRQRS
jgi:hypothetical protein